ncbi:hypothetical protein QF026_005917 [Streptomyces aurantiacus]|nr:hypothetical protein [Streptomyces aurantiacus]
MDGIPQLLPSSGEQVTDEEHEQLLRRISGGSAGSPAGSTGSAPLPGTMTP